MRQPLLALIAVLTLGLGGCGYNKFQTGDEQTKAAWWRC